MARKNKTKTKKERIQDLKTELETGDKVYKENVDNLDAQIDTGLRKIGFPQGASHKKIIEDKENLLEEYKIKLKIGFKAVNARWEYEESDEWANLLEKLTKVQFEREKDYLNEILEKVQIVVDEITEQQKRMEKRRPLILEELKELGVDTKELEKPKDTSYIG